jgi:hypothetical protein
MAATIGFYLSGVIAIAIIFIGCRFLLVPSTAAAAYGVPAGAEPHLRAYLSAKGIRIVCRNPYSSRVCTRHWLVHASCHPHSYR